MSHSANHRRRRLLFNQKITPFAGLCRPLHWLLVLLFTIAGPSLTSAEQPFRVVTSVFRHGSNQPVATSTSYFSANQICDISGQPDASRALIVDRSVEKVTIIDRQRQLACTVSLDELMRVGAALGTRTENKPPLVKFAANPVFDVKWFDSNHKLKMNGEFINYDVETVPEQNASAAAQAYREFADWSAQVSATRKGGLPSQARLELNDQLSRKRAIPKRVELTFVDQRGQTAVFYSTHKYDWQLTESDQRKIAELNQTAKSLKQIDLAQFRFGTTE